VENYVHTNGYMMKGVGLTYIAVYSLWGGSKAYMSKAIYLSFGTG